MGQFLKDPNATLDYTVDWADWMPAGDSITTVTWVVPAGLTKTTQTNTATAATAWLSGGTVGTRYVVVCRITTVDGRIDDRTLQIDVQER